ncbi:potassium/sodium efflux P-type ATPase [Basidiobolus meristosporus CBS 931.73]|uniref:P-type Na(+) transporter n=1 Tax=Basidiobolus meristosporus CBS 931.73 TaxID=1314790 RepID=A0A1Y1Y865_9FUNG|nr:potassium/sodium efflux P-type ATPase [Basidiobolus meristosporus CBS 931.73]|eukprot:ORX93774.1 potassium/sodium efflux P-type ATPase [Basidiobolus meristosporus CBS 931.73]
MAKARTETAPTLPYHTYDVRKVVTELKTDTEDGLTSQEIKSRTEKYGANQMSGEGGVSPWKVLLRQLLNYLTVILIIAMCVAFSAKDWVEGGVIAFVIILNTTIGFFQEYRAEKTMDSLRKMASPTSHVIRDGNQIHISTTEVVPGDILLFENGDVIGADCRLFESFNLEVDEALLTGESVPVPKTLDLVQDPEEPIGDRRNMVYASTTVTKGRGKGIVTATGMDSEIGKIAKRLIESETSGKTALQRSLDKMALVLFGLAIILAIIVFAVNKFKISEDIAIYAISVGIAVIPEGLIAVVTLTMAAGVRNMAHNKAIVRQLSALEALGSVTNICSDKTGTLTQSKMVLTKAYLPGDGYYNVSGTGFTPEGEIHQLGELSGEELGAISMSGPGPEARQITQDNMSTTLKRMIQVSSLCNMAIVKKDKNTDQWVGIGDPTETALQVFATKLGNGKPSLTKEKSLFDIHAEFPFDSTVKRMSVVYTEGDSGKHIAFLKGATERVVECCSRMRVGDKEVAVEKKEELMQMIGSKVDQLASNGLRVLSLAYRYIEPQLSETHPDYWEREQVDKNMVFLGLVGIYDPPRAESKDAVRECYKAGIRVHMLTGDHPATATAIAREVAILPADYSADKEGPRLVMTATEFDSLSDSEVDALPQLPHVIARCSPDTKVKMIEALHRRNKVAAMTGDGVNDSPSLKIANIGIAMGMGGSDVAKNASDIVLTDDNFSTIVRAVEEGRRIFANIQKFVLHLMSTNVSEIIALIIGLAFIDNDGTSVYPMSPVQILFLNMVTSSPPAMSLGLELANPLTMRVPPRPTRRGLFNYEAIADIVLYGAMMGLIALADFIIVVYGFGNGSLGTECNRSYSDSCDEVFRARGTVFTTLTLLFLIHAYNCRSLRQPQWLPKSWKGLFENKALVGSFTLGVILIFPILYIPYLNTDVFKHKALTWEWGVVAVSVVIFIVFSELYKFVKRRFLENKVIVMDENDEEEQ